jgi:hypothetical protein
VPTAFDQNAPEEPESLPAVTGVDHDIRIAEDSEGQLVSMSHGHEGCLHG